MWVSTGLFGGMMTFYLYSIFYIYFVNLIILSFIKNTQKSSGGTCKGPPIWIRPSRPISSSGHLSVRDTERVKLYMRCRLIGRADAKPTSRVKKHRDPKSSENRRTGSIRRIFWESFGIMSSPNARIAQVILTFVEDRIPNDSQSNRTLPFLYWIFFIVLSPQFTRERCELFRLSGSFNLHLKRAARDCFCSTVWGLRKRNICCSPGCIIIRRESRDPHSVHITMAHIKAHTETLFPLHAGRPDIHKMADWLKTWAIFQAVWGAVQ